MYLIEFETSLAPKMLMRTREIDGFFSSSALSLKLHFWRLKTFTPVGRRTHPIVKVSSSVVKHFFLFVPAEEMSADMTSLALEWNGEGPPRKVQAAGFFQSLLLALFWPRFTDDHDLNRKFLCIVANVCQHILIASAVTILQITLLSLTIYRVVSNNLERWSRIFVNDILSRGFFVVAYF